FYCVTCTDSSTTCTKCLVSVHAMYPFHQIKEWEGSYYKWTTLMEVGLVVQLGHHTGDSCLNPVDEQTIVVIDIDGVHEVHIWFCSCHLASLSFKQLLHAQWFLATVELSQTAITFHVFQHFQMLSFMLKVLTYKYYHTLA
ncbi:hypothetical protein ARMGADRAFT_936887, partial [Armillaria gallica]